MAYETGTATDFNDLMSKLFTFAVANGWTRDYTSTEEALGQYALHKNSVYISWRRVNPMGTYISLHQALGFTDVGTAPGSHTDDSGNGYNAGTINDTNLLSERHVQIGNGPYSSYHFFEQDSGPAYLHIVVQTSSAVYRHWGFGNLDKFDTFTGGEYCYGQMWNISVNNSLSNVYGALLDGLFADSSVNQKPRASTIHVEGLTSQPAASKWGQVWGAGYGSGFLTTPNDTAGNTKEQIQGGFRAGPVAGAFGWIESDADLGLIPGYPIYLFHVRDGSNSDHDTKLMPLGCMPDVRGCSIDNFAAGDELSVGSDTWVIFPTSTKGTASGSQNSGNQGIIYKKVTA